MLYYEVRKVNVYCTYMHDTHPRHKLHKDGEFPLFEVPQTAVVLNNTLVAEILQQLDLTLQSIHFLQTGKRKVKRCKINESFPADVRFSLHDVPHLACVLTVGIKGHLLGGQLAARVGVIAEVDLPERPAPQEFSLSPVHWRPRSCRNETPHGENPAVIHFVPEPPEADHTAVIY